MLCRFRSFAKNHITHNYIRSHTITYNDIRSHTITYNHLTKSSHLKKASLFSNRQIPYTSGNNTIVDRLSSNHIWQIFVWRAPKRQKSYSMGLHTNNEKGTMQEYHGNNHSQRYTYDEMEKSTSHLRTVTFKLTFYAIDPNCRSLF